MNSNEKTEKLDEKEFKFKELKERFKLGESEIKIVIVDVGEQPIERPKYEQEKSYSSKKTAHDKKYQIVMNAENKEILYVYGCNHVP